jgi:hypothetical protein
MSTKRRGLGKGVDALFPAEEEVPSEELEGAGSKSEVGRSNVEVRTSQGEGDSKPEGKRSKVEGGSSLLEGLSYNQEVLKRSIQEADKNPRITLWSPISTAMLKYLRKTIPEFSISEEASTLLEEAIVKKYPELYEGLKKEKESS